MFEDDGSEMRRTFRTIVGLKRISEQEAVVWSAMRGNRRLFAVAAVDLQWRGMRFLGQELLPT